MILYPMMGKPLRHYRGDTWRRSWLLKDGTGAPIDLTGASARLHLRLEDDTLIAEADALNGRLVITPLDGRIDLTIEAAFMRTLDLITYLWDLEVNYASGVVRTIEQSRLVVTRDITHV